MVVAEHIVFADESFGLLGQPLHEVRIAKRQPVLTHVDCGLSGRIACISSSFVRQ